MHSIHQNTIRGEWLALLWQNDQKIARLDPLHADEPLRNLPAFNTEGDRESVLALLRQLLPSPAAARALSDWRLKPTGTEGYRTAEVTLGGVDTSALHSKTLEAKTVPGLFLIGECVDVTGWLGGYNFQWAWSSAWAAARAIRERAQGRTP